MHVECKRSLLNTFPRSDESCVYIKQTNYEFNYINHTPGQSSMEGAEAFRTEGSVPVLEFPRRVGTGNNHRNHSLLVKRGRKFQLEFPWPVIQDPVSACHLVSMFDRQSRAKSCPVCL